jgi:hypothetical protein
VSGGSNPTVREGADDRQDAFRKGRVNAAISVINRTKTHVDIDKRIPYQLMWRSCVHATEMATARRRSESES